MNLRTVKGKRFRIVFLLLFLDILFIAGSFFSALLLRYDIDYTKIPLDFMHSYLSAIGGWVIICILVFALLKLYQNILTFAGQEDLIRILVAYVILSVLGVFYVAVFNVYLPRTVYFIGWFLSFASTLAIRFSHRIISGIRSRISNRQANREQAERIMIIGAGNAGRLVLREYLESDKITGTVVCFIDDNLQKKGCLLNGVPIVGTRQDIVDTVAEYRVNKIIYAIPSSNGETKKDILNFCFQTGCQVEIVPGIYQLANGLHTADKMRKVELQDLLGRDLVQVNLDEIYRYISDKVVMVTGGGGSIGSELCRQIAFSSPKQLIIFDIYENNAYDIQMELRHRYPDLNLVVLIGSVRNTARLDYVMEHYKPDIVFHAAAHKHVPLMEDSPNEAIKNNVFGTYKMAEISVKHGVKKFVLISTDKAVNPTNIMGASKRLCEMVVQMMNRRYPQTEFVAVRFGNVLGSNGSVIPLFKRQINEGGPVTVTHPEITRFFMTIPEAVSLVLQAGYYAKGGEIYVLDMGEPVKIADMARNLIRLSGYEPDYEIQIKYTGLRPGEKLYEELLMDEEGMQETENRLIHIGKPIEMDDALFQTQLERLKEACATESEKMKYIVAEIVTTYRPSNL